MQNTHSRGRPRRRRQAGFTLAEVLMATVVVGIAAVGTSSAMSDVARTKHELAQGAPYQATLLAKEIHELAQSLPRTPSGAVGVTSGADVAALDSLVGATFSPPIRADASTATELSGWTQTVDVAIYALDDLCTPTGETAWMGLDPHAERLYKLTVTVEQDGAPVETCSWWLTP